MGPDQLGVAELPQKPFVVVSPFLVDPASPKRVNVGDGFILDSCVKLIGARPAKVISSRLPISEPDLDLINSGKLLLFAGANTLKSDLQIAPGFTPQFLERISVPVALMGIGHYGTDAATAQPLDSASDALVREILRRFPFVSVRCDASSAYLRGSIPSIADQVLMTSCPVVFPVDGIDRGFARPAERGTFVFTLTDRAALEAQVRLMAFAASALPANRRVLALHQDYGNRGLVEVAQRLGYEVLASPHYQDFLALYRESDLHLGNRVHAHLKCLSLGVRSFLTPFDLRQSFFAESLDFPLIRQVPTPELDSYDFGRARARIAACRPAMDRFTAAVRGALEMPA